MKIQLIHPPVYVNPHALTALRPAPPLGLAYIAASLRKAGYEVPRGFIVSQQEYLAKQVEGWASHGTGLETDVWHVEPTGFGGEVDVWWGADAANGAA